MTSRALSAKPFRMVVGWLWSDGFSPEELRYGAIMALTAFRQKTGRPVGRKSRRGK